jgi:hypothetical protein
MTDRELLELIARVLERQMKLLEDIRDQLVPPTTYPQPVAAGSSLTVRS